MKCKEFQRKVPEYLDSKLSDPEKDAFDSHLCACPQCAECLRETEDIKKILATAPKYPAPPYFASRVMARIEQEPEKRFWFNFFIGEPAYLKFIEILVVILMVIIGLISGNMLISGKEAGKPADIALSYSLDVFEPTPPGSVGSAYLLVMEEES
jgi:hypothetical protein